jgi:hypothetical protein
VGADGRGAAGRLVRARGGRRRARRALLVRREFARFAAANAEWRSPASGFAGVPADRFGDVRRAGVLAPGAGRAGVVLDHTAFTLLDVPPPADGAGLELRGAAPAGTASALALVARRGPADGGQVVAGIADLPRGGPGGVVLPPGRYDASPPSSSTPTSA